ncbi:MAG: hypothetical protein M1820_005922 [Bogoriella megaspora]|nr:MAG: hypothetical protein M1820_005922 [Bogoriella megaspora]
MWSFNSLPSLLCLGLLLVDQSAAKRDFNHYYRQQKERLKTAADNAAKPKTLHSRADNYRYYNNKTSPYFIEKWPDVNFDTGEFYSGSVPIDESDPSRSLFWIFKPAIEAPVDEVTIWLNGGPGCSSLIGFFQENGPILWQPGIYEPTSNPYSWANITNMLYVEQPVGTGFSVGQVRALNEVDIAKDFVGFFKNWEKLFDIQNYKIYVTGESYAGRYVPYISAQMLDQNDTTYYDLSGALVYDPCIGSFDVVGQEIPTYPFVVANNDILNINDSYLATLESVHQSCGYADWFDKYLQFPPPGNQPEIGIYDGSTCDIFDMYASAANEVNPCFNIYHINDYCPLLNDVLSNPGGLSCLPQTYYFDRADVKAALHAPANISWGECSDIDVFLGNFTGGIGAGPEGENDRSPDPIQGVLPQVIEATNRVIVSNGNWDGLLLTNGTLLQIQNMTWNGQLGFQSPPTEDFIVPTPDLQYGVRGPQGIMGKQHFERGLLWIEGYQAGHEQPQYQPRAALRHIQWLLGRIDQL